MAQLNLDPSWQPHLKKEFDKEYMLKLREFLAAEYKAGKSIFPKGSEYFSALNLTPYDQVKVVVLGQDPYHGPNQAHGLCFSVKPGVPLPPSLQNIYKEIRADLGIAQPTHGFLESWAKQGVLLLNSVLTVEQGRAGAHQNRGWESFTDEVIRALNARENPMAFVLWGAYAQKKAAFVDKDRHLVLQSPHPSPLSASRGFFGCRHFSKINRFLVENDLEPIDWQLPPELN